MTETALYRFYATDGTLLYVGITGNTTQRWAAHASEKPWWPEVARKTVEWFEDRATAEANERIAIGIEVPRYNVRHAGGDPSAVVLHYTSWWEYVQRVARGDSTHKIGAKMGVGGGCVARWKYYIPTGDNVVAFARAYGINPLVAMVEAGYLRADEVQLEDVPIDEVRSLDIIAELQRRMKN